MICSLLIYRLYAEFCVSLGWLYCYGFSPGFNIDFLSTSQEIGWEDRLRYDLFSVE